MSAHRILMAGLPETGKTTFLAALWHQLESGEITTRLTLTREPSERKYLNENAKRWARSEALVHTSSSTSELITFELEHKGQPLIVQVPDLPGEVFRDMWKKRVWSPKVKELASEASGLIFFVRANDITMPVRVDQEVAAAVEAGLPPPGDGAQDPARRRVSDMANSPTAAQVAHILQSIQGEIPGRTTRLALVVSAWDTVVTSPTPRAWLKKNLPLVDQYLSSNADTTEYEIFGVSAQGGNVRDPKKKAELLAKSNPSTRVQVLRGEEKDHDLTRVLAWVGRMG